MTSPIQIPSTMEALVKMPHWVLVSSAHGGHVAFLVAVEGAHDKALVQLLPWQQGEAIVWRGKGVLQYVKLSKLKFLRDTQTSMPQQIVDQPGVVAAMVRCCRC